MKEINRHLTINLSSWFEFFLESLEKPIFSIFRMGTESEWKWLNFNQALNKTEIAKVTWSLARVRNCGQIAWNYGPLRVITWLPRGSAIQAVWWEVADPREYERTQQIKTKLKMNIKSSRFHSSVNLYRDLKNETPTKRF